VGGGLAVGGVAALGGRDGVALAVVERVVIAVGEAGPGALEVPADVVREQADEEVAGGAVGLAVVDGPGGEVDALEGPEELLGAGEVLVRPHRSSARIQRLLAGGWCG
jgi:hypothetical protein